MKTFFSPEFIRFLFAGGLNTFITFCVYYLLVVMGFYYLLANLAAWTVGILFSFFLNSKFVFTATTETKSPLKLFKFACVHITNFFISSAILAVIVENNLVDKSLAQLIVIPIIVILNFLGAKFLVFK